MGREQGAHRTIVAAKLKQHFAEADRTLLPTTLPMPSLPVKETGKRAAQALLHVTIVCKPQFEDAHTMPTSRLSTNAEHTLSQPNGGAEIMSWYLVAGACIMSVLN